MSKKLKKQFLQMEEEQKLAVFEHYIRLKYEKKRQEYENKPLLFKVWYNIRGVWLYFWCRWFGSDEDNRVQGKIEEIIAEHHKANYSDDVLSDSGLK